MKSFSVSLLTLLLLTTSAVATIESVCQKAAAGDPAVKYNFCVSLLKSVPGSSSATDQGLAVIAGNLAVKQATATGNTVDSLLKRTSDPKLKKALEDCQGMYKDAISTATDATNAVKAGRLDDAKTYLSVVLDTPTNCEQGFHDLHLQSPVKEDDDKMEQASIIALSITSGL